ncbi:DnaJ-like protein DjlA [Klebsiella pneumoniae subsp. pneumoniae]|nr:DnaJ-like protein DjlA [Klebsiella pneumoniae subsp. pneumoniae]
MQYLGKVIGVAVALLMGGGFWGVVLGFLVGHMFDRARSRRLNLFANQQERQSLFFSTTFEVMGHLTKSKGRVTEADIHVANVLMDRMNLHGASRTAAQQAFRDGKADNYPLREKMRQLRSVCFGRFDLIRMFLEISCRRRSLMANCILTNGKCCSSLPTSSASPAPSSINSCG